MDNLSGNFEDDLIDSLGITYGDNFEDHFQTASVVQLNKYETDQDFLQNMTILIENEIQEVPIFFCNCCFPTFFRVSALPCIYVAWK